MRRNHRKHPPALGVSSRETCHCCHPSILTFLGFCPERSELGCDSLLWPSLPASGLQGAFLPGCYFPQPRPWLPLTPGWPADPVFRMTLGGWLPKAQAKYAPYVVCLGQSGAERRVQPTGLLMSLEHIPGPLGAPHHLAATRSSGWRESQAPSCTRSNLFFIAMGDR